VQIVIFQQDLQKCWLKFNTPSNAKNILNHVSAMVFPEITSFDVSNFHHCVEEMKQNSGFLSCNFVPFSTVSVYRVEEIQAICHCHRNTEEIADCVPRSKSNYNRRDVWPRDFEFEAIHIYHGRNKQIQTPDCSLFLGYEECKPQSINILLWFR